MKIRNQEEINKLCDEILELSNNTLSPNYVLSDGSLILTIEYITTINDDTILVSEYIMKTIIHINKSDLFNGSKYILNKDESDKDGLKYTLTFTVKYDGLLKENNSLNSGLVVIPSIIISSNITDQSKISDNNIINQYPNNIFVVVEYNNDYHTNEFVYGEINIIDEYLNESNFFIDSELSINEVTDLLNTYLTANSTQLIQNTLRKIFKEVAKDISMYTIPDFFVKTTRELKILGFRNVTNLIDAWNIRLLQELRNTSISNIVMIESTRLTYINPKNKIPPHRFSEFLFKVLEELKRINNCEYIVYLMNEKSSGDIFKNKERTKNILEGNSSHLLYIRSEENLYDYLYGAIIGINEKNI